MSSIFDITVRGIDGAEQSMAAYKGKVMLIVNFASKCCFTPQYAGLEALWRNYRDKGLMVMGFPCNQFGAQEPGDEAEIGQFCSLTYDVNFPMFAKLDVNGSNTHPLYEHLKSEAPGLLGIEMIKWNFTKFLVDREGKVAGRYAPNTEPKDLAADIEKLL